MKIRYIYTIVAIFALSACSDFLEPKSQSEYVPKDANALQEMLIGSAYPAHKGGGYILTYLEFFSDDIQLHKTDYQFNINNAGEAKALQAAFTWQPDMFFTMTLNSYNIHNIWDGYYDYILGANAALDYIDDVEGTDDEKNYVRAQAYALRSFYYFMLVNHFGAPYNYNRDALGVPLKLDSQLASSENLLQPRNTVEDVYNQILKDLDEAERLFIDLPEAKQNPSEYLVGLPMIQLLKSRVYLYMERWADAQTYAAKVINDWSFVLHNLNSSTYAATAMKPYYNFTNTRAKSPEIIWLYGKISDLTDLFDGTVTRTDNGTTLLRNAFTASTTLLNSFKTGDLRKDKYISKEFDRQNNVFLASNYSAFGKYNITERGVPDGSANFALSFRLSEAYLNLAEAAAFNGQEDVARDAIHTLLQNRYSAGTIEDATGLSGNDLQQFIRDERRKELCMEGQRWFDLRRYGMPALTHAWDNQNYTLQAEDPSYTMPIPEAVLERNTKLVQNPLAPARQPG
ncbi:MAG: RagB/SusD family nutrient uptake outer membrane protein [Dysgonamonadaceae bacterium]|jgi:hypothetical protein|nr:RagB/SusD family nutrient uptake outer membrane protein [Dysgonamonadaceae bacterium]